MFSRLIARNDTRSVRMLLPTDKLLGVDIPKPATITCKPSAQVIRNPALYNILSGHFMRRVHVFNYTPCVELRARDESECGRRSER